MFIFLFTHFSEFSTNGSTQQQHLERAHDGGPLADNRAVRSYLSEGSGPLGWCPECRRCKDGPGSGGELPLCAVVTDVLDATSTAAA